MTLKPAIEAGNANNPAETTQNKTTGVLKVSFFQKGKPS